MCKLRRGHSGRRAPWPWVFEYSSKLKGTSKDSASRAVLTFCSEASRLTRLLYTSNITKTTTTTTVINDNDHHTDYNNIHLSAARPSACPAHCPPQLQCPRNLPPLLALDPRMGWYLPKDWLKMHYWAQNIFPTAGSWMLVKKQKSFYLGAQVWNRSSQCWVDACHKSLCRLDPRLK